MNKVLCCAVLLITCTSICAQDPNVLEQARQRIISDLVFIYVDKPQLPSSNATASTTLNNADIAENRNLTGEFWTNTNNQGSQDLVKRLLQPPADEKGRILQYLVATLLQIQEKRVKVFLFNDKNNTSLTSYHPTWSIDPPVYGDNEFLTNPTPNPWVWPHAMHQIQGEFAGYISMGSAFLTDYIDGKEQAIATIIHELTHTQDNAQFATRFVMLPYGMDGSHNPNEILANFYAAYTEGIANAFSLMYLFSNDLNVFKWLRENSMLHYECTPSWACQNLPANCCIDVYLRTSHSLEPAMSQMIEASGSQQAFTRNFYNIRDLPSDVLIHNEGIQSNVFYVFMRYFSVPALVQCLKRSRTVTRGNYGFAYIFEEMVTTAGSFYAQGAQASAHLYPIAILDFMTGFKLSDETVLNRCLRTRNTSNWSTSVSEYWSTQHRGHIMDLHGNTSGSFPASLMFDIAVHYNVRSRQPAAGRSN